MSTLTMAPAPAMHPVAWRRLAWVAWRRYRSALLATLGVLGVVAVYLFISGHQIHDEYAAWRSCTPAHSARCTFELNTFQNKYGGSGLLGFVQVLAPGLVGAFVGAPLLARELESGTFRYAWTQGVGRTRWAIALLAPGVVGCAVIMAAFGALVAWRNQPLIYIGMATHMDGSLFPAVVPAVVGWTLLAFALGVFSGLLLRRVVPALVATVLVWFGVAVLASLSLRNHYLAPLTTTRLVLPKGALTVSQWWTKAGHRVSGAQINQVLQGVGLQDVHVSGHAHASPAHGTPLLDPVTYLVHHGYQQVTSYQPASRYWTFQWIELGWLTVLAAGLLAATLLLLRRRDA